MLTHITTLIETGNDPTVRILTVADGPRGGISATFYRLYPAGDRVLMDLCRWRPDPFFPGQDGVVLSWTPTEFYHHPLDLLGSVEEFTQALWPTDTGHPNWAVLETLYTSS